MMDRTANTLLFENRVKKQGSRKLAVYLEDEARWDIYDMK